MCHPDNSLSKEEQDGSLKSLFIKEDILVNTVHEGNGCVLYRIDTSVDDFPHHTLLVLANNFVTSMQCHAQIKRVHQKIQEL